MLRNPVCLHQLVPNSFLSPLGFSLLRRGLAGESHVSPDLSKSTKPLMQIADDFNYTVVCLPVVRSCSN